MCTLPWFQQQTILGNRTIFPFCLEPPSVSCSSYLSLCSQCCSLGRGDVSARGPHLVVCRGLSTFQLSLLDRLSKSMYNQFYTSLRTRDKLLGLFSAACEVVLGLSDKRQDDQPYHFISETEQPSVLLGREAYPISSCVAKETSTRKQISNTIG